MLIISNDQTISSAQGQSNNSGTGGSEDRKKKEENLKNAYHNGSVDQKQKRSQSNKYPEKEQTMIPNINKTQ